MNLDILTAATGPALSLADAKTQLRVDVPDDDGYILALISAATAHVEQITGRALAQTIYKLSLDFWPKQCALALPRAPVTAINSIKYLDAENVERLLNNTVYQAHLTADESRLSLAPGQTWPTIAPRLGAVRIEFVAGYEAGIPAPLSQALKLLVSHWYENRLAIGNFGGAVPLAFHALIAPFQICLVPQ
jgi:uncharacterized phiE125 gp8 family phage protein